MPISFECDCGYQLRVRDEKAGRKVRCPECSAVLLIPNSSSPVKSGAGKNLSRQPGRSKANSAELPPSRSSKRKNSPATKTSGTGKNPVIVTILLLIIFTVPAWIRSKNQPKQNPNTAKGNTVSNAVSERKTILQAPEPKQDALSLLEAASDKQPSLKEGWIRVIAKLKLERFREVSKELVNKSGVKSSSATYTHGMIIADLDTPEMADVASKISFGKVLKVNADTRTILVDASVESESESSAAP